MGDRFFAAHAAQTTHGHAKRGQLTPTYRAWRSMRNRVAHDPDYEDVAICSRWSNFSFFLADMGEQPVGKTLDRVGGSLLYSRETCRWATPTEQANNTSRNVRVAFQGKTQTLAEWARELGLNYKTVHNRVTTCGWSVERALTAPHRGWSKQGRVL